jgi:hypothetical protein
MSRIAFISLLVLLASAICLGQSSYKGLTPGTSTRADVDRVLGQPVNKVSETLVEYAPPRSSTDQAARAGAKMRLYVQYRPGAANVVERVAVVLNGPDAMDLHTHAQTFDSSFHTFPDAAVIVNKAGSPWLIRYYGGPFFAVWSIPQYVRGEPQIKLEYYSRELYEGAVPKGGCNGTFIGEWETDRGRMTISLAPEQGGMEGGLIVDKKTERRVRGSYSKNNGSFTGKADRDSLRGDWKDDTGSGSLSLNLNSERQSFKGSWMATDRSLGTWQGQCVESNTGRKP